MWHVVGEAQATAQGQRVGMMVEALPRALPIAAPSRGSSRSRAPISPFLVNIRWKVIASCNPTCLSGQHPVGRRYAEGQ